jgi:outer membrane immunogenic protein
MEGQEIMQEYKGFPAVGAAGWTLGAGLDYALTDRWIGRVEYRYANFGTFSYNPTVFGPVTERHKTTENAFRLGLAYKFW